MLSPKVIKLLKSLAGGDSIEKCLIPNAENGEMALCTDRIDKKTGIKKNCKTI